MIQKAELRKKARQILSHTVDIDIRSERACQVASIRPVFLEAKTILCYRAIHNELDPAALARTARQMGKRVAYPVCMDKERMEAYIPDHEDAFETDAYQIKVPILSQATRVPPEELDFILVPGLAFTAHGARLGRGRGYYDRYFLRTDAYRAGFCMETQLMNEIPMDKHDIRMQSVLTDKHCY